jgi:HD superfamily phosphohydrolase
MFTQVYFHKTRVAFDIHLRGALKEMLQSGVFPEPKAEHLDEYLRWDDWRVLGYLSEGAAGEHGNRLARREQYKRVYATPEVCSEPEYEKLTRVKRELAILLAAEESASKSWYKTGKVDIPVVSEARERKVAPLSQYSSVIASIKSNNQVLLYAKPEDVAAAKRAVERALTP